jgi:hypothetical protein
MKPAGGRPTIALALIRLDARAAERNPYGSGPSDHEALRAAAGPTAYPDRPK